MSIIKQKQIIVSRKIIDNRQMIFLDCDKLRKLNEFKLELYKELAGDNRCLAVIDTKLAIGKEKSKMISNLDNLQEQLKEQGINFSRLDIKSDANYSIFGIPVKFGKEKVKSYILGIVTSAENIEKISNIIDSYNPFYYFVTNNLSDEEVLNKFNGLRGDMEELVDLFEYHVHYNDYFRRIRICPTDDMRKDVEQIINKQIDIWSQS